MNRSKQRGTAFESAVVEYLRAQGGSLAHVERRVTHGAKDGGDLANVHGLGADWVCELKALRELDVAGAVDEAEKELRNWMGDAWPMAWCAAILKRRRRGVADSYVVMTLEQFARLLSEEG